MRPCSGEEASVVGIRCASNTTCESDVPGRALNHQGRIPRHFGLRVKRASPSRFDFCFERLEPAYGIRRLRFPNPSVLWMSKPKTSRQPFVRISGMLESACRPLQNQCRSQYDGEDYWDHYRRKLGVRRSGLASGGGSRTLPPSLHTPEPCPRSRPPPIGSRSRKRALKVDSATLPSAA